MKALALLAALPLAAALVQDDLDILRARKIKALDSWLGKWKAELTMLGNSEVSGMKLEGEVEVRKDLGDTAIRFDGFAAAAPPRPGAAKLYFSGMLTFNHAATYSKQAYTATFFWSEDGRTARATGDYKGNDLHMKVELDENNGPLNLRVVGDNPRRLIVSIPPTAKQKGFDWLAITLTR